MDTKLIVSAPPHIRSAVTTWKIMLDVLIALTPSLAVGTAVFGARCLLVALVCIVVSVLSEWIFEMITKRPVTVGDLSAAVTGMILALTLPPSIPLWQAGLGAAVATVIVKQLFGGIGKNFANPAATARIVLMLAFPAAMTAYGTGADAVSSATPLMILRSGETAELPSMLAMFLGERAGCIGETSAAALLIGAVYLLARRVITFETPAAFIASVALISFISGRPVPYDLMAGGLLLGAFFMATDYTTAPITTWGKVIFGLGCGGLTMLMRIYGNNPEGVSFAILLMNIITPYISKLTASRPFGGAKICKKAH